MSTEDDAALEREFDMLMVKAGAAVPPDRKAGIVRRLSRHEAHDRAVAPAKNRG